MVGVSWAKVNRRVSHSSKTEVRSCRISSLTFGAPESRANFAAHFEKADVFGSRQRFRRVKASLDSFGAVLALRVYSDTWVECSHVSDPGPDHLLSPNQLKELLGVFRELIWWS